MVRLFVSYQIDLRLKVLCCAVRVQMAYVVQLVLRSAARV